MFIKSGKQRRAEIRAARLLKAEKQHGKYDIYGTNAPLGSVAADHEQLLHNNTYGMLPTFYMDKTFECRDCGSMELWTAKQQKWWYEIAKGHIDSIAVSCRPCRKKHQARKAEARQVHLQGLAAKQKKANS